MTVLLTGPSGSGKSWLAREIWRRSPRRARPFEDVSCAELQENLLESQLFGHAKGAFTGADQASTGLIRSADGGTVFLDEIGTAPAAIQAKLLRVLDTKEVRPLGSARSSRVNVRFMAATNADLQSALADGTFRPDLYHRLAGISLTIDPLRERRADIVPLLDSFLGGERRRRDPHFHSRFSPNALEALLVYDWPGNVRELANTATKLLGACSRSVDFDDLPEAIQADPRGCRSLGQAAGGRSQAPPRRVLQEQWDAAGQNMAELVRTFYPDRHYTTVRGWLIYRGIKKGRR